MNFEGFKKIEDLLDKKEAGEKVQRVGCSELKEFGMSSGEEKNDAFHAVNEASKGKKYGGGEVIAKDYEVSKGREELIPTNIKDRNKIKYVPSIRSAFDRVGPNMFRDKQASKYWTLKEKIGEDGKKSIYLVAVESDDPQVKQAAIKEADAGVYNPDSQNTSGMTPEQKAQYLASQKQKYNDPSDVINDPTDPNYYQGTGQSVPKQDNSTNMTDSVNNYVKRQKGHSLVKDYGREFKESEDTASNLNPVDAMKQKNQKAVDDAAKGKQTFDPNKANDA